MRLLALFLFILFQVPLMAQSTDWQTKFEISDYLETVTYEECMAFSKALAEESPMINYQEMGYSPQNRAIPLLIIDKEGLSTARDIKSSGRLILFIQAGIHAGEPDGTDATFLLLRDMVIHQKNLDLLNKVSILFIPSFNVDGLARMSPYNRINQNGPKEMGWRANSLNLNLNRDYMKADSPEMKAWLKIFNEYLPDLFIDCHTTDGADYQYVATYAMETFGNMDEGLTEFTEEVYNPYLVESMKQKGAPIFPYVTFMNWHDPRSGLVRSVGTPMISQGYTALQNRIGLLIETHMLKPYKPRVYATKEMIISTLETMNKHHKKLKSLNKNADAMMSSYKKGIQKLTIKYDVDYNDTSYVDFLGMEYEVVKSDLTGGDWFQYSQEPITFDLILFEKPKPIEQVELPIAYIIPVEYEEVQNIIKNHGIEYKISKEAMDVEIETYKFSNQKWGNSSFESHQNLRSFDMVDVKATQKFEAGAMVIPVRQRALKVIVYLLEPKADNSLVSWGFFNSSMERKEYAETYVMEKMAREMIAENPSLMDEFNTWKEENPELAKNHWMQCMWFYAKTPYMDPKKDVYPVGKIVDQQELFKLGWH
ncbi:M14 family metallopeptidase [Lentimicrobium sp. L6]|uniref:M14 family metallopeptidase n=1 Tax=Lentimicrobium sp. L6 TaxID=2735916 RepID=UPI001C131C38|nr:M14 family metallopeptidase [Lentimicrobium sp. L6]NPD86624.1 M14 family metallopeptidase [Lentimicrobium sp. L6]